jgi:hypothetical protein
MTCIVDVDAHHYENEYFKHILPFMETYVLRQLTIANTMKGGRGTIMPTQVGYQDMGGRVTRYCAHPRRPTMPDTRAKSNWANAGWMRCRSNAMSGTPIISGTNQLPNPPMRAGMIMKNTMIMP